MHELERAIIYSEKDARSLLKLSSELVRLGHVDEAVLISSCSTRILNALQRILNESKLEGRLRSRADLLETESLSII